MLRALTVALTLTLAACGGAETPEAPAPAATQAVADHVVVTDARVRATPPGAPNSAAFMTLRHEGDATALVGAKAQVSDTVELHTHTEVDGMMQCIRKHLAPGGEAILNTFAPRGGYEALKAFWSKRDGTTPCWTKPDGDYTLSMADDCTVFQENPVAAFPRLIYRRHDKAAELVDEQVLEIVMRVWQPDELLALIERHGFTITQKLGGYNGEAWGDGPELVVSFTH